MLPKGAKSRINLGMSGTLIPPKEPLVASNIKLPQRLWDLLTGIAKASGHSRNEVIRMLLEAGAQNAAPAQPEKKQRK